MSALQEYDPTEAGLALLRQRYADVAFDLTTTAGNKEARAARMELVKLRTDLEAKRRELKAPALERSRLIDAEAARIREAIIELEEPIDAQIKADEARREVERQARAEAERKRLEAHQVALQQIRDCVINAVGGTSAQVQQWIDGLEGTEIAEGWEEFQPLAITAKAETLAKLREIHGAVLRAEAEAARIAAERAELERMRAEAEQREREAAAARRAAELVAEETRRQQEAQAAAARAQIEAEQKAAREKIEAEQREARARIEAAEAQAKAERDAAEAAARAAREIQEAAERAQRKAEKDRQRAEREAAEAAQRHADETARKAREAEEARQAEERRLQEDIARAIQFKRELSLRGREMLESFVARYGDEAEFTPIAKQIVKFLLGPMKAAA